MRAKRKFKIVIDIMMTAALPLLMAYQLIGEAVHEWLGICMFLLFVCHHLLNGHWHRNLLKGRYNRIRLIGTAVDILLFIIMISLAVSGVMMSKHIFVFLQIDDGAGIARIMHLLASYWGLVLMSVHIGLHWNMISVMIKRAMQKEESTVKRRIISKITVAVICSYGIYAFVKRKLGTYLFLKSEFVFFDFREPLFLFLADYIAIMILFGFIGKQLGTHRQKKKEAGNFVIKLKSK